MTPYTTKRTLEVSFRFLLYGVLGFLLERLINLVAYGTWFDNSVLFGPVQPMYAVGMMGAVWAKTRFQNTRFSLLWMGVATYLFTASSEWVSGMGYRLLTGRNLWDYRQTFSVCQGPYTCWLPTGIFAFLALCFAFFIAPRLMTLETRVPLVLKAFFVVLFVLDIIITYGGLYAQSR